MSAIAEAGLVIGAGTEHDSIDGVKVLHHPILCGEEEIGSISRHGESYWFARIGGSAFDGAWGGGGTPEQAMRVALTSGIVRLRAAVENVVATTEAKGDELLALVEGLA